MNLPRRPVAVLPGIVVILAIAILSLISPTRASAQTLDVGNCAASTTFFYDTETVCASGTTAGNANSDPALVCVLPSTGGVAADDVTPDGCNEIPAQTTFTNEILWSPPTVPDSYIVVLFASDETVHSQVISIFTDTGNTAPTATPQSVFTAEDTALQITLTGTDPEFDPLTFAVATGPSNGTLSGVAPNLTYTPDPNFNGADSLTFTASDAEFASAPATISITVNSVNDNPVVSTPIANQTAIESTLFSLDISANFSDADNDALTFVASGLPMSGNLVLDAQSGVFSGTPEFGDARENNPYTVFVTASDGQPGSTPAQTSFALDISALDRADLMLDISVTPGPAMLNDELLWTLTVGNIVGPQAATNVEITGSFVGAGLSLLTTSSCSIQPAVGQVSDFSCSMGVLPVGASTSAMFTAMTSSPGDVVGFASALNVDAVPIDPNIADNSRQVTVGVAEAFSLGAVQVLGNAEIRSIAAGDVDGDGVIDLIAGTAAGQSIEIYSGGGFRDYATTANTVADNSANEGIEVADFDSNGTLDLVVANGGGQADIVYSNDGAGNFTVMTTLGQSFSQDVAVGDFDADGIPDIVFATTQGNPVYLGDGSGGFALHAVLGNANSHGVAVARLNGDTRDDIVFANTGADSQVWIKNAGAGFTQGDNLAIGDAVAVAIDEFGGDPRPDLAFGRVSSGAGDLPANPVVINNGAGGFGAPIALLGASQTSDIHAADVNGDGLTDLVFINPGSLHQIWTATGSGFDLHPEQIVDAGSTVGIVTDLGMTDVGNPGGADLAMGGAVSSGLGIFLNDSFGNLGYGDAVPPVITLTGAATLNIPIGSVYSDAGASAQDNIDGDISQSIVVSGSVNTAVVGDYVLTYSVVDRAGNDAAPITRTVAVTATGTATVLPGGGDKGSKPPW